MGNSSGKKHDQGEKRKKKSDLAPEEGPPSKRSKRPPPPPPPPPPPLPPFTNWQNNVVADEKTQQDIIYYEIRDVLCNVWMKTFVEGYELDARDGHMLMVGLNDLNDVNQRYLDARAYRHIRNATSNERLLNLLERIHRVVCSYPQEDRGLGETLLEDPNMPTEIAGVIAEFDANMGDPTRSAPQRQHGRSRCTCRLQHSNASNDVKKERIDQIRSLVCNVWGEELDRMLQIIPGQAGYLPGDGPFKQTADDPNSGPAG